MYCLVRSRSRRTTTRANYTFRSKSWRNKTRFLSFERLSWKNRWKRLGKLPLYHSASSPPPPYLRWGLNMKQPPGNGVSGLWQLQMSLTCWQVPLSTFCATCRSTTVHFTVALCLSRDLQHPHAPRSGQDDLFSREWGAFCGRPGLEGSVDCVFLFVWLRVCVFFSCSSQSDKATVWRLLEKRRRLPTTPPSECLPSRKAHRCVYELTSWRHFIFEVNEFVCVFRKNL